MSKKFVMFDGTVQESPLTNDDERMDYIVPAEEIEEVVDLSNCTVVIMPGCKSLEEARQWIELQRPKLVECRTIQDKMVVLMEAGALKSEDFEEIREEYCYDLDYDNVFNLADTNQDAVLKRYQYWDGSDWETLWVEDEMEVEVEEIYYGLDRWHEDGNKYYRERWNHGRIYTVLSKDGEPTEGVYLLYLDSDWLGTVPCGILITEEERDELLESKQS